MYSTKEKLRILREINNPEAVGADLALFRQALPADPRLVKFDLSPQRHAEEITLSLLDHYTREEIVANRRDYSKQIEQPDNSDLENMTDDERDVFDGYNRAQRDRIREIIAEAKTPEDALASCSVLETEGFNSAAEKIRAIAQKELAERELARQAEANEKAVAEFKEAVEAIGEVTADDDCKARIDKANELYEAMNDEQKELAVDPCVKLGEIISAHQVAVKEAEGAKEESSAEAAADEEGAKEESSAEAAADEEPKKKSGKSKSTQE
ncbi:MAG: hypothetical protein IKO33_05410 [Bacteroidaceae bacterium]|nr:hypothetical protein [Bacteroidaceae bacterium]